AVPLLTSAAVMLLRWMARSPLTTMLPHSMKMINSSTVLKPSFEVACNRQHGQKTQRAIDQRHIQVNEPARDVRVECDQTDRQHGQHVDRSDAIDNGTPKYQAQQPKQDADES